MITEIFLISRATTVVQSLCSIKGPNEVVHPVQHVLFCDLRSASEECLHNRSVDVLDLRPLRDETVHGLETELIVF